MSEHLTIAAREILAHEGMHLKAYPDPRSPLGRELVRRLGAGALDSIGHGRVQIPQELARMDGRPWTIGVGQTGPDIGPTTVWSRQHAQARFEQALHIWDARAKSTWPGAARLHPKARAALISLAYNRGTDLTKRQGDALDRRREMRELQPAVLQRDYLRMAELIESMGRIWAGEGMGGLIRRRMREARLCREAAQEAAP